MEEMFEQQLNEEAYDTHEECLEQNDDCHRRLSRRLTTIEGHVRAVRKMLDEKKDCMHVTKQLLAIESSVKKVGIEMLNNHINTCLADAVDGNEIIMGQLKEFHALMKMYL